MSTNYLVLCCPLLLLPSIFSASGAFPMSWFFQSGGQSIGVSISASALPVNIQDWFPLELIGWISLQSKGLSRVFSNTTVQKHQFFDSQLSSQSNSHPYMTTEKTITLTRQTFADKVVSLLFNMLSGLVIVFLPRYFMASVTICSDFGAPQNKISHCFHFFPIYGLLFLNFVLSSLSALSWRPCLEHKTPKSRILLLLLEF